MRLLLLAAVAVGCAAPLPAADPPAPKGEAKAHEIPYRLTDTKHVLVRVKLNGKGPFNFILDTGAPAVFVPKKLAADIGLKLGDDGWGRFDKFQLEGGLTVRSVDPAAVNAELVHAGVRVTSLVAQRRSLEAAVLDATGDSSDRVGR